MSKLIATKIEWDTDNEVNTELPETIDIPNGITDEEEISEYISEQTGFCHNGFTLVRI